MRTANQAIQWARAQALNPSQDWYRWCLKFVRMSLGAPASAPDAGTAWDRAQHKHRTSDPNSIPAGVPVFWELPSVADHVALSTGNGKCLSNDIKRRGKIDEVSIDLITRSWGGKLLGWTEDLNGVMVYQKPVPKKTRPLKVREALKKARAALVGAGPAQAAKIRAAIAELKKIKKR